MSSSSTTNAIGNNIAVLNRAAPYSGSTAQDSLDFIIAMSNFGQDISVFFSDDGIYQLLKEQNPVAITRKQFTKGLAALHFYDIENLYVCSKSLSDRNLNEERLNTSVTLLPPQEFYALLKQHQHVVTF